MLKKLSIFIFGFILIGGFNAATMYEFLEDYGFSFWASLVVMLTMSLIWGAPYVENMLDQIGPKITKEKSKQFSNVVNSNKEKLPTWVVEIFDNDYHHRSEEKFKKMEFWLKTINQQYSTEDENKNSVNKSEKKSNLFLSFLVGFIQLIGLINIFVSPISRAIGGYEVAKAHMQDYWQKILIVLGIFAGIGAWFLNKYAVFAFADKIKSMSIKLDKATIINVTLGFLSLASFVLGAYYTSSYPSYSSQVLYAVIGLNVILACFFIMRSKGKSFFNKISHFLKSTVSIQAFLTSAALAVYAYYTGQEFLGITSGVFSSSPIESASLNVGIGILCAFVTLVTSFSFFYLFASQSIESEHKNMDPYREHKYLQQIKQNDSLKEFTKKTNLFYFCVYFLALIPTVFMGGMAYMSTIATFNNSSNVKLAEFLAIILTITSSYLSYRFFVSGSQFLVRKAFNQPKDYERYQIQDGSVLKP